MTLTAADGIANFTFPTATDRELILTGDGISENVLPQTGAIRRYYHYSAGSGSTLADDSGNSNDGTVSGATWASGYGGFGSLDYDGSGDYVDIPRTPSQLSAYTAIFVTKHDGVGSYNSSADCEYNDNTEILMRYDGSGTYTAFPNNGFNGLTASITEGTWYMFALRVASDGSNTSFIVNDFAQQDSNSDTTTSGRDNDPARLGGSAGYGYDMFGEQSLHLLYDVALSDSEISQIANDLQF